MKLETRREVEKSVQCAMMQVDDAIWTIKYEKAHMIDAMSQSEQRFELEGELHELNVLLDNLTDVKSALQRVV